MSKKISSLFFISILAIAMSFVVTSDIVFAQDVSATRELTVEEQMQIILNDQTLSLEDREFHAARIALFEFSGDLRYDSNLLPEAIQSRIESYVINPRIRSTGIALSFRQSAQLTNWWCGPATAAQTLRYWNQGAYNTLTRYARSAQHEIAFRFGMITQAQRQTHEDNLRSGRVPDLGMITSFVNNQNSAHNRHRYVATRLTNRTTINNNIISALRMDIPPIIRMETPNANVWPYTISGGHFLNITGVQTDSSGVNVQHVLFTDTWMGSNFLNPASNGTFWRSFNDTYTVLVSDRDGARRNNFAW